MNSEQLRSALLAREFELPPLDAGAIEEARERPWYISLVLGAAAWLASVFTLLFVGEVFDLKGPTDFAVLGAVLLPAAFGLYYADRNSAFFDQLALAVSLAGQIALSYAAVTLIKSHVAAAAAIAGMQMLIWVAMPNFFARVLAMFFACIAWAIALRLVWWGDLDFAAAGSAIPLLPALTSWLSIWVPIGAAVYLLVKTEPLWIGRRVRTWIRPAVSGLLLALALGTWASEPFAALQTTFAPEAQQSFLALWPLLGAACALFALGTAFLFGSKPLIGIAIVGALLHLSQFYYVLGTSLTTKSILMLATGAALLAAGGVLQRSARARDE